LDARNAGRLAERLNEVLASGHTAQWAQDREADLDALPDETCPLCGGSGERHDEYIDGPCNGCAGRGRRRPIDTWYEFSVENVAAFRDFVAASGGFKIC
jgi:hypothetical protein